MVLKGPSQKKCQWQMRAALHVGATGATLFVSGSLGCRLEPLWMTRANPIRSFGSGSFSGFHPIGFSLFAVLLWGEREHATPAGSGSRDVEFSLRVNSSLGHRCGGDNNVSDPYVLGGELLVLRLGWIPVFGSYAGQLGRFDATRVRNETETPGE